MRRISSGLGAPAGLAISLAALLAACSGSGNDPTPQGRLKRPAFTEDEYGVSTSPRVSDSSGRMPKGGGTFKLGSPYRVAGRWYVPSEDPSYDRTGVGSWYGDDFHGRKTANGEIFDMHALTAAHPTLPLPSYAYVTNLQNGRTILVRVNDRGPYVRDRIIDLSHASARALGYEGAGRAHVRVRYAGRAPLNGDDRRERQYIANQPWMGGRGPAVAAAREPFPVPAPRPAVRRADGWSAADYRASLAGKPVPSGFARSEPRMATYDVANAPLPPIADTPPPGRQNTGGSRLVWQASPPSQPAPWQNAVTGSTWRGGLGAPPSRQSGAAYVQVGTFREAGQAERLRGEFAHLGPVEVAPVANGASQAYRVRIGPMTTAEAQQALREIGARGVSGGRIVTE